EAADDVLVAPRVSLGRATVAAMRGDPTLRPLALAARQAFGPTEPGGRAAAEALLGVEALYRGDASWRDYLGRALEGWRAVGDRVGEARALHNMALGQAHAGEHASAITRYGEAIAACVDAGRLPFPLSHINRALLLAYAGQTEEARADAELGLRLARERGLRRDAAYGLWTLAKLHARDNRWPVAAGLFEEALGVGREAGDALVQADALAGLAEVALRRGLPDRAWELVEQGAALRGLAWWAPGGYELALVGGPTLATLGRRAEAIEGLEGLLAAMEAQDDSPHRRARAMVALAAMVGEPARAEALRERAHALAAIHGYGDLQAMLPRPRDVAPPVLPASAPELELRLFGRIEALVAGELVTPERWRGPRIRLLLAYLSLERRGATREQLEAAFFGGADASRAAVALMIKRLREALEPGLAKSTLSALVLFEDGRYMLNRARAIESDVERFAQALELAGRAAGEQAISLYEEALERYRGPLLAGFEEAWVEPVREGARRQALEAVRRLGDQLILAGRAPDALRHAELMGRRERLAEEPVLVRMAALAALGRREEARRAAVELGARLQRDLGLAASDEVEQLALVIMRGEWQPPRA
ncbi:MAG: putative large rane protein, partial [Cyanobacteria bacterium RYN_339]|nr:putative large rane protein [Cyanobacteria bacterium RYN_339]